MDIEKKIKTVLDKLYLKSHVKQILESLHFHNKNEGLSDILICSTPRSGSTLLYDLIALNSGVKAINEPLHMNTKNDFFENSRSRYCHLNPQEEKGFKSYFDYLFGDKISTYPYFDSKHKWLTNRTLIKCLRVPGLINWFLKNYDCQVIYLVRHPIPASLSRIKNGWGVGNSNKVKDLYPEFYESEVYKKRVLNNEIRNFIEKKVKKGTTLDRQIIMWCLENVLVLRNLETLLNNKKFIFLTYEKITLASDEVLEHLADVLRLFNVKNMKEKINKPSSSSQFSGNDTKQAIRKESKKYLVNKWKEHVNKDQEKSVTETLDAFGINIYNGSSIYPHF